MQPGGAGNARVRLPSETMHGQVITAYSPDADKTVVDSPSAISTMYPSIRTVAGPRSLTVRGGRPPGAGSNRRSLAAQSRVASAAEQPADDRGGVAVIDHQRQGGGAARFSWAA